MLIVKVVSFVSSICMRTVSIDIWGQVFCIFKSSVQFVLFIFNLALTLEESEESRAKQWSRQHASVVAKSYRVVLLDTIHVFASTPSLLKHR